MKKRKLLFTMLALSLGCLSGGSGAMAQTSWVEKVDPAACYYGFIISWFPLNNE